MSSNRQPPADDGYWRRPTGEPRPGELAPEAGPGEPAPHEATPPVVPYAGPPRAAPPPYGWRPPVVIRPAKPHALPPQDHAALDLQEQSARTVTMGTGLVAGAVMLILLFVLCGRWLF